MFSVVRRLTLKAGWDLDQNGGCWAGKHRSLQTTRSTSRYICRIMILERHIRNKTSSSANGLRISSKTRSLYSWPRRASCAKAFFGIPQIFAAKETARPSGLKHVKSLRSGMPRTLPSRATVVHGGTNCFLSHYVMLEFGQEVKNPWLPALANENKTARR